MSEPGELRAFFRQRHHEAVRAMHDAHRAESGDSFAAERLLSVLSEDVTDERAAVATELSVMVTKEALERVKEGPVNEIGRLEQG